jgi:hypothetical protein
VCDREACDVISWPHGNAVRNAEECDKKPAIVWRALERKKGPPAQLPSFVYAVPEVSSASCALAKMPRQRRWHRRSRGFGHVRKSAHDKGVIAISGDAR